MATSWSDASSRGEKATSLSTNITSASAPTDWITRLSHSEEVAGQELSLDVMAIMASGHLISTTSSRTENRERRGRTCDPGVGTAHVASGFNVTMVSCWRESDSSLSFGKEPEAP